MTRQPDWDLDKARGEEAEQRVRDFLGSSIANGSCEVKRDDRAEQTGNVYVEQSCQTVQGWMPSGINTTKATDWAWVLYRMRVVVWLPVWLLRNTAEKVGKPSQCTVGTHPTRGVLIPVDRLLSEARVASLMADDERKAA